MRLEISVCVRSSAKRSRRISWSRGRRTSSASSIRTRISARASSGSSSPSASASVVSRSLGRLVERARSPRADRLERRQHLLDRHLDRDRELLDARRAAELAGQLVAGLGQRQLQLLHPARHVHRPRAVAEVALELAEHGRRRVGAEAHLARDVEALDRLHDPDARDLHEVVERLAAADVAAGQRACKRHHLLGELVARREVAVDVVAAQQLVLVTGAGSARDLAGFVHAVGRSPARRNAAGLGRFERGHRQPRVPEHLPVVLGQLLVPAPHDRQTGVVDAVGDREADGRP